MTTIRSEARRKGLRMAAHVAALSGVLSAAAAAAQTTTAHAEVPTTDTTDNSTTSAGTTGTSADGLADLMRVSPTAGCGCAPCWGPPAPPAMHADLLALFDEVA